MCGCESGPSRGVVRCEGTSVESRRHTQTCKIQVAYYKLFRPLCQKTAVVQCDLCGKLRCRCLELTCDLTVERGDSCW